MVSPATAAEIEVERLPDKRDFYEVLGVSKDATQEEVSKAYKKAAMQSHPDMNPDDREAAEEKMKEINEANDILSDKEKRRMYDQFGHAGVDPSYQGGGGGNPFGGFHYASGDMDFNIGDIFGDFFSGGGMGDMFGGSARRTRNPNAPAKGRNIQVTLPLDFMEAVKGATKRIRIPVTEDCSECGGSGAAKGSSPETCSTCNGSGRQQVVQNIPGIGAVRSETTCSTCGGKGTVVTNPCEKCSGSGHVKKEKTLSINIPAGVNDGDTLPVRGEGSAGANGGPAGDVLVTFSVRPDPIFERDGYDIWVDMPLTYSQLALGDEVVVPTVDGKVKYKVPEGTQPGKVFMLRDKGVPYVRGEGRGEQYVRISLEVPQNLNGKQKEALKNFEGMLGDKNYEKRKSFFERVKDKMGK